MNRLENQRLSYLSSFQEESENITLRLLYADSASVIQDCMDMIHESALECGIPVV